MDRRGGSEVAERDVDESVTVPNATHGEGPRLFVESQLWFCFKVVKVVICLGNNKGLCLKLLQF